MCHLVVDQESCGELGEGEGQEEQGEGSQKTPGGTADS